MLLSWEKNKNDLFEILKLLIFIQLKFQNLHNLNIFFK
jgi:hypothetical protein